MRIYYFLISYNIFSTCDGIKKGYQKTLVCWMSFKSDLRNIVEDNSSKTGKYFDYVIQSIILLSLVTFSLETVPSLYNEYTYQFELIEKIIVIIFSVEYLLRVYVAKNPFKYIFSFYGIIDLLSTLPFYLKLTFDLRFIRIFRVFRIFRALKSNQI